MTAARKNLSYVPALDGLRAVAVFLVIVSHVGVPWMTGGGMGVDMFFVLSGFLITTLLLEEIETAARINVPYFYARRLLRLYPALLLMLVLFWVFCDALRHSFPHMEELQVGKDIFFAATYLTDYAVAFGFEKRNSLIGHTWSLAVEEQFYLLWPWVLIWMQRQFRGKSLVTALLVLYGVGTAWRIACLSFQSWELVYFRFDTRLAGLVLGAALAAMRLRGVKISWALPGFIVSAIVFAVCVTTMPSMEVGTYEITAAEIFTFFAIYLIMDAKKFIVRDWLSLPIPVFVGRISYALYLFHFPAGTLFLRSNTHWWLGLEVTVAVAMGLAWFSWNTVEKAGRIKAGAFRRPSARRHVPGRGLT